VIDRETQIELMKTARERHDALIERLKAEKDQLVKAMERSVPANWQIAF
jgi:hypothetical protein